MVMIITIILTNALLVSAFVSIIVLYMCRPLVLVRQIVIAFLFSAMVVCTGGLLFYSLFGGHLSSNIFGWGRVVQTADIFMFTWSWGYAIALFAMFATWILPCWFVGLI
eukprot:Selendium_serpulae@DN10718_c0_g1_i1.p1